MSTGIAAWFLYQLPDCSSFITSAYPLGLYIPFQTNQRPGGTCPAGRRPFLSALSLVCAHDRTGLQYFDCDGGRMILLSLPCVMISLILLNVISEVTVRRALRGVSCSILMSS